MTTDLSQYSEVEIAHEIRASNPHLLANTPERIATVIRSADVDGLRTTELARHLQIASPRYLDYGTALALANRAKRGTLMRSAPQKTIPAPVFDDRAESA